MYPLPIPILHSSGVTQRQILTCWTSQPAYPPCRAHCSPCRGNSSECLQVCAVLTFQRKPPWPRAQLSAGAAAPVHTSARLLERSQFTGDIGTLHVTAPGHTWQVPLEMWNSASKQKFTFSRIRRGHCEHPWISLPLALPSEAQQAPSPARCGYLRLRFGAQGLSLRVATLQCPHRVTRSWSCLVAPE